MFNHLENDANMDLSEGIEKDLTSAISGKNNRDDLPEMVTQSLLQSKDLITSNNKQANESPDSLALCVGRCERKKQRIGVRLTITERKSLEFSAKQKGLSLSDYARHLLTSKQSTSQAA